jgi:hypothetical protein
VRLPPGQAVTITAFVEPITGTADPTGSLQFSEALTDLGTLSVRLGQASVTRTSNDAGTHTFHVAYSGDGNYCDTIAVFGQAVDRLTATLALESSASTST